ncbi:LysR family transcriptional regulator [Pseudogracilibacillus sp. SO30301A]|uniref:LysR family transcriptional regulator n=1 Tax=Pseudogracilibacillus sp. SO30301A TaxID=3098291 RepID=UPI00300DFF6E
MDKYLEVFVTVVEHQNFSRAAEELHMTQPAVSQYIRLLEEDIGSRLLERTNKYVRINKAGEIVYHHAKEIIGLYTKMESLIEELTNKAKGKLTIGASYTFGEYVLPQIISIMQPEYPDIQPIVTIGNTTHIAELVESHQLDIGIVEGRIKKTNLFQKIFTEDELFIVASSKHPLHHQSTIPVSELSKAMWIIREKGSGTREAMDTLLFKLGIQPEKTMEFSSTQPIKEVVAAGLGVSLLSKWAIQKELNNGDLVILRVKGTPFSRQFSYITNSPFQTKALELFITYLHRKEFI